MPLMAEVWQDLTTHQKPRPIGALMRYGVTMFATDLSMDVVELAREAEARGLQSPWLPEHTHIPASRRTPPPGGQAVLPEEYRRLLDPPQALAQAASSPQSCQIGVE